METLARERFEDFVGRRIFAPLGMATASYFKDPATHGRRATLYRDDGVTPYPYWHLCMRPSGAINASAAEMGRLARLLVGRGTFEGRRLVSPESVERMERPATTWAAKAGVTVGYGLGNFPTLENGSELGLAAGSLLLLASAPLFAVVWLQRKLLGRMAAVRHLAARAWPLVSSLCCFGAAALFELGLGDPFQRLGHPTAWSVGYAVFSLAFAATAAIGAVVAARSPIAAQNRWAAWHSRLVAAAAVLVSGYLAYFGLIGLRTWV